MANKILIPTPLRPFTGKQDAVEAEGRTVGELLANLTSKYEGLRPHLYNEQGKLRSFVNVYLNDEDIRYLEKDQTAVKPGDTISRTGFMCLLSSDMPDVAQENVSASKASATPNYELTDWPVGVQIVSARIPEKLLSTWLVHWFFAYQAFLGIQIRSITIDAYDCLGNAAALAANLEALNSAIEVAFSAAEAG